MLRLSICMNKIINRDTQSGTEQTTEWDGAGFLSCGGLGDVRELARKFFTSHAWCLLVGFVIGFEMPGVK